MDNNLEKNNINKKFKIFYILSAIFTLITLFLLILLLLYIENLDACDKALILILKIVSNGLYFYPPLWISLILLIITIVLGIKNYRNNKEAKVKKRILIMIFVLALFNLVEVSLPFAVPYFISKSENENCNITEDNEEINVLEKMIELDDKNETFKIDDKITINFIGIEDEYMDEAYTYVMDIYLNDNLIDSNIFGNSNNRVIWSSNYAAKFKVLKLEKYYIFVSSIAKQNDGDYVLIIDEDGNFIKNYEDVSVIIDKENLKLNISDCLSSDMDEVCETTYYYLNN